MAVKKGPAAKSAPKAQKRKTKPSKKPLGLAAKVAVISAAAVLVVGVALTAILVPTVGRTNRFEAVNRNLVASSLGFHTEKTVSTDDQDAIRGEFVAQYGEEAISEDRVVTYQKTKAQTSYDDLTNFGLDDDVIYPGALLKIGKAGTSKQDLISPLGLDAAPITLSLGGIEGSTGISYEPQRVENPSVSLVRQAVSALVGSTHVEGAQLPYKIATQLTEVKSREELAVSLNVGVEYLSVDVENQFNFDYTSERTNAVFMLKQVYYTVDMDRPNRVKDFFGAGVSPKDLEAACGTEEMPVYASVTYGRMAVIKISTTMDFQALSNTLSVGYNSLVDVETSLTTAMSNTNYSTNVSCFIYGGSNNQSGALGAGTDIGAMIGALNQPYDPLQNIGVPISYKFRYLDGTLAKVAAVNEYVTVSYGTLTRWKSMQSGERKVNEDKPVESRFIHPMNYTELQKAGYTKLNIHLSFERREVDDGWRHIELLNQNGGLLWAQYEMDFSEESYVLDGRDTYGIPFEKVPDNVLTVRWSVDGSAADEWAIRNVELTVTAVK